MSTSVNDGEPEVFREAVESLSRFGGTVLKSSLSKEQEAELQAALHGEQAPASTATQ